MDYSKLRKFQDAKLQDKTVVVRCNFDVPLNEKGEVLENTRIAASVDTINHLLEKNCKIVLIAHLGRPNGEQKDDLSLMPVRFELGKLLEKPIKFAHITACENSIKFMENGEILLLENLRFNPGEESEDPNERKEFVRPLAQLCDYYISDNFTTYREHASVYELPQMVLSYGGYVVQREIDALSKLLKEPQSPYIAVLGGAKIDSKLPIIEGIVDNVDKMLVGGALAYTFLAAQGVDIGNSKTDEKDIKEAKKILNLAKKHDTEIVLPIDHICGKEFDEKTEAKEIDTQQIPKGMMGLDIGPRTMSVFREIIESSKTILWNGPMGVFEWDNFNKGTEAVGEYIALSTPKDAFRVAGGGDTLLAMKALRIKPKRFNHISVGGGMMTDFIAGEKFSVLEVLVGRQYKKDLLT